MKYNKERKDQLTREYRKKYPNVWNIECSTCGQMCMGKEGLRIHNYKIHKNHD